MSDPAPVGPRWLVEEHRASAAELHALDVPDDGRRRIWSLEPTAPAVVLGSTTPDDVVDRELARRGGVDVVRRRSGGGAVWVSAGDPVWVDIVVPRTDALWHDDVGRSFQPIGEAWSRALTAVGIPGTTVHAGPMMRTEWSDLVCFAGTGPGEVFLDGRKIVGMSQRRSRAGARFQCALPRRWDAGPLGRLLRPRPPAEAIDRLGAGIGDVDRAALVGALVAALG